MLAIIGPLGVHAGFPQLVRYNMTRRFWIISAIWILAILAAAPLIIETLDDRDLGIRIPGLSVTGGEIVLIGLLAAAPPLVAGYIFWRRSRRFVTVVQPHN
jgi:hypothetical protein